MHNGMFDIACMYHSYGINLVNAMYHDTILSKHTVDEERPFGLKDIGEMLYGEEATEEQKDLGESVKANGGKWTKTQKDIWMGDPELVAKYAIKDVILTANVFIDFEDIMEEQGLVDFFYEKEVMPLYRRATIPMKLNGVFVDVKYFEDLKKQVEDGIIDLTEEVFSCIKDDIEPKVRELLDKAIRTSRTGQFAEALLRYYDLPVPVNKRTGKPTLAKSALRRLLDDFPKHPALIWLTWECPKIEEQQEVEVPIYSDDVDPSAKGFKPVEGDIIGTRLELQTVLVNDPKAKEPSLPDDVVYKVKKELFVEKNPELPYVFNLSSTHHLGWLIFDVYGQEPTQYSKQTGKPKVDKDSLEVYDLPFIKPLAKLKKEEKLLSTYINPILEKQHNGWIYPSMQQWGTTSGRYSCGGGLNLQTLPRDDMRIKKGFVAPEGYKVVNADFSALEPRIFSWVSQDPGLKEVWLKGYDLYSQIAIDVFGLDDQEHSADPNADNYLKKVAPEWRQKAKVFTLAVPYGANAGRIASIMKVPYEEAQDIINRYLDAYPGLKNYMWTQEENAMEVGMVYTEFGRIRHLPLAKELSDEFSNAIFNKKKMIQLCGDEGDKLYYKFRTTLNNSKNFPIQATAAHVTNASLILLADLFDEHEIDGWICLQVHDEITCIVREDQAELAAELLKFAMENNSIAKQIDIPMVSEPLIADSFAEAK